MLFFFEAGFFALALAALALAELRGPGQALVLWAVLTVLSLLGGPPVRAQLARRPPADRTEAQWRHALADSWRHFDKLLLLGLAVLAAWWWVGR